MPPRKPPRKLYPERMPSEAEDAQLTLAFGRAIRAYRKAARLRLDQMASLTGMSPSRLHKLEKGRVAPWLSDLMQFAALFGISAEGLLREAMGCEIGLARQILRGAAGDDPLIHVHDVAR